MSKIGVSTYYFGWKSQKLMLNSTCTLNDKHCFLSDSLKFSVTVFRLVGKVSSIWTNALCNDQKYWDGWQLARIFTALVSVFQSYLVLFLSQWQIITTTGYIYKGHNSHFNFASLFERSNLQGKKLLLQEQILSLNSRSKLFFLRVDLYCTLKARKAKRKP